MIKYQKILNKNLLNVFKEILKEVEKNGLDGNNHLYITFATNKPKIVMPNWLLIKYPTEMTIVIQNEYYNLSVNKNEFRIGLSFNNKKSDLQIPFNSVISFADPSAKFGLNYSFNKKIKIKENITEIRKKKKNQTNVIEFSNYKKN
tara:strand:- start:10 stop:447 length:438 start_codon:yes stop_codon:yes gene_type:complete